LILKFCQSYELLPLQVVTLFVRGAAAAPRRVRDAKIRTWDDLPWAAHPVTLCEPIASPVAPALRHPDGAGGLRIRMRI
jgi:hypothetical protein